MYGYMDTYIQGEKVIYRDGSIHVGRCVYMGRIVKTVYFPEDLYHRVEECARKRGESLNKTIITLIEIGLGVRATIPEGIGESESTTTQAGEDEKRVQVDTTQALPPEYTTLGSKNAKEAPEATEQAKAEPPKGVPAEAKEPERPEFPRGEVPLAGVPSSEKPKEPPVDFSWATRREKLRELVVRWVDVFRKWGTKDLVDTFRRCKGDDPTREAVIIVMKERFGMKLPETEKATIRSFFMDEEVRKFMEEHGIEGIKEPAPAEEKEEQKEGEEEGGKEGE